jgi:hypothetical protein
MKAAYFIQYTISQNMPAERNNNQQNGINYKNFSQTAFHYDTINKGECTYTIQNRILFDSNFKMYCSLFINIQMAT